MSDETLQRETADANSEAEEEHEGFVWWREKLGAPQRILAPMVDQSELAWRLLSKKYGAQLVYTPMLHAAVFVRNAHYRRENLKTCAEDRPLIVQFCANDPEILLQAAKYAEPHCDGIDLNLGCPQFIAKRGHYGSFLQDEWDIIHNMVDLCARELTVPITCKIRVFEDVKKTIEYAQMLEKAGAKLLTVHGRTREQKGSETGLASWAHITAVRENVRVPIFANGNIQCLEDVHRCLAETRVQGVMTAEGNLHNPGLLAGLQPPLWQIAEEYLAFVRLHTCPMTYVRGHLFKLFQHALHIHPVVRDAVGSSKTLNHIAMAIQLLKDKCQDDVKAYEADPTSYTGRLPQPYWICQPYVRPGPDEKEEEKKLRMESKRPLELKYDENHQVLSKNKLRKLRRQPDKTFDFKEAKYVKCPTCGNPKGTKCAFDLCKLCCKNRTFNKTTACPGHKQYGRRLTKKAKDAAHRAAMAAPDEDTPSGESLTIKPDPPLDTEHSGDGSDEKSSESAQNYTFITDVQSEAVVRMPARDDVGSDNCAEKCATVCGNSDKVSAEEVKTCPDGDDS